MYILVVALGFIAGTIPIWVKWATLLASKSKRRKVQRTKTTDAMMIGPTCSVCQETLSEAMVHKQKGLSWGWFFCKRCVRCAWPSLVGCIAAVFWGWPLMVSGAILTLILGGGRYRADHEEEGFRYTKMLVGGWAAESEDGTLGVGATKMAAVEDCRGQMKEKWKRSEEAWAEATTLDDSAVYEAEEKIRRHLETLRQENAALEEEHEELRTEEHILREMAHADGKINAAFKSKDHDSIHHWQRVASRLRGEWKEKVLKKKSRRATYGEYESWLAGYMLREGEDLDVRFKDLPFSSFADEFLRLKEDIKLARLCGSSSVSLLVPAGVEVTGDRGHCKIYYEDEYRVEGGKAVVYSDMGQSSKTLCINVEPPR